jgi:hypothetical protein
MSRDFRNSRSQTALSPAKRRRKRADRKLLVETLERRELLATLTSGSGDGHLTVQVNEYGAFGRSGMLSVSQPFNQNGPREVNDAIYDPVGPIAAAGTIYEALLMIKVGGDPVRVLSDGVRLANGTSITSGGLPGFQNGRFAGQVDPLTRTVNSTFYYPETAMANGQGATLRINLQQTLIIIPGAGPTPAGVTLRQTYTITNLTPSNIDVEIWRYVDGDMLFDGDFNNDGGGMRQVMQGDPQRVWMTNTATNTNRNDRTYLEVRSDPAGIPVGGVDRWEVGLSRRATHPPTAPGPQTPPANTCTAANPCKNLPYLGPNAPLFDKLVNDLPLVNDIVRPLPADIDGNNKVDNGAGDDWAVALHNVYTSAGQFPNPLPGNGNLVYVANTQWGNPEIGDPDPPIIIPPTMGTVAGTKFSDSNGNGVRDPGEVGIGGFRIYADVNNNGVFNPGEPTAVSNATGFYQFTVPLGTYNIREVQQANWTQTFPAAGFYNVTLATDGQVIADLDFGNKAVPGSVSGIVFEDFNKNGRLDPGEVGLGTAFIYADLNNNGVFEATEPNTTSAVGSGAWVLDNLDPRTYVIRQIPPAGYDQTFPSNNAPQVVAVSPAQNITNVNFGDAIRNGSIAGQVYVDSNNNGMIDPGEGGAAGVIVYVDADNNCNIGLGENAIVTGPSGTFGLNGVRPGTYTVRLSLPAGYEQVLPSVPGGSDSCPPGILVTVEPGMSTPNTDFLIVNTGGIGPDFGDAPAPYPTLLSQNGARHTIQKGFGLGALRDGEPDGQPNATATGDDISNLPDEDGIVLLGPDGLPQTNNIIARGQVATIQVTVSTGGFFPGKLQGFIDFNQDGDWNDPGERIISNLTLPAGVHVLSAMIPANAAVGTTYARFRYGYEQNLGPTGPSISGEVEDYQVIIAGPQPIAVDDNYSFSGTAEQNLFVLANDIPSQFGPNFIIDVAPINASTPIHGTVTIVDGQYLTYVPAPNAAFDQFKYTITDPDGHTDDAVVTINVQIPPIAVDDSFLNVAQGVNQLPLNVLANDTAGVGTLTIVNVMPLVSQGGTLAIAADGKSLLYTPATVSPPFAGVETFQYTVENGANLTATANVTIQVTPGNPNNLAEFDFKFSQLDGSDLPYGSHIGPGQLFLVNVTADDLRTMPILDLMGNDVRGVAAAYLDVLYDQSRLEVVADDTIVGWNSVFGYNIQFNQTIYKNALSGSNATAGILDETGGTVVFSAGGSTPIGANPVTVFTVTMRAKPMAPNGVANLYTDPADVSPDHDVLQFAAAGAVPVIGVDQLKLNQRSITIDSSVPVNNGGVGPNPEPNDGGTPIVAALHRNATNQFDVNADGKVTPLDALLVVNSLNFSGPRSLLNTPAPSGPDLAFLDVDGDNYITPLDALMVVTRMNSGGIGSVLAEGEPSLAPSSTNSAKVTIAPGASVDVTVPGQPLDAKSADSVASLDNDSSDSSDLLFASNASPALAPQFVLPSSSGNQFDALVAGASDGDEEFDNLLTELAKDSCHHWAE